MIDAYVWGTPNGRKVPIVLEELALPYRLVPIDIGKGEQKSPEYLAINPNGKIPAIVDHDVLDADGRPLRVFESGAILLYLAEKTGRLLAPSGQDRVDALAWTFWQVGGLGPMIGQWGFFSRLAEPIPVASQRYLDESLRLFGVLDTRLDGRLHLAGDLSIADIMCYPWAKAGLSFIGGKHPEITGRFPHVESWIDRLDRRPAFAKGLTLP